MTQESEPLEALNDIRRMMKESSRFLSLSGLSGILAGIYALLGAAAAHRIIGSWQDAQSTTEGSIHHNNLIIKLLVTALAVFVLSLITVFFLSGRKARKGGHRLFDHSSRKLIWSMALPMLTGGIFCLALLLNGGSYTLLVAPAMLVFYGLALVASSRLTLDDVRYLGYLEILLGLVALFYQRNGLLFWALGFGVLHIVYGAIMWYKYDRRS